MARYVIALDQSTRSTKAFLYDQQGSVVRRASLAHAQLVSSQGWISHDLNEIYHNVCATIAALFADGKYEPDAVAGIGLTNQRETVAAWSRADGHALGKAVVWQCTRAKPQCERMRQHYPDLSAQVMTRTGLPLSPLFPAAKFAWLLEEVPAVQQAAANGDLCLGTIDSWLVYRLTHGAVFATEPSNASRTQLFDLQTKRWDAELCQAFGIPMQALPEVRASDADFGMTDCEGLFREPVPLGAVLGDSQAALFGQSGEHLGDLKITYGTGSSIMVNVGSHPVRSHAGLVTSIGWQCAGDYQYVLEGNVNYAGAMLAWLQDGFGILASPADAQKLALAANPSDQTVIVPAFTGLGAPYWQPQAQAAILNMSAATKAPELVKAALDAIAFQINAVIAAMRKDDVALASTVAVDGGPTRNDYLMQVQSDLSAVTVKVSDIEDISAFGVALLAGSRLGVLDKAQNYLQYRAFRPQITEAERTRRIASWQAAVKTVIAQSQQV